MYKPLVALTPTYHPDSQDISMRPTYLKALAAAGAIPVVLPLNGSPEDFAYLAKTFDGFIFTGGPDPHPFLFGEETHVSCGSVSTERDTMELSLMSSVMKLRKPILGICRGIQILNIGLGGTIYQDIPSQSPGTHLFPLAHRQPYSYHVPSHTVALTPESRLAQICDTDSLQVNSMHHQAVKDLAPGLKPCAIAPDGLIEAMEMTDYPWFIAVQWHPEYLWEHDSASARLFQSFVKASGLGHG